MSDGSKRVISYDNSYPICNTFVDGDDTFSFSCSASPGVREEQPEVVPFRFLNTVQNAPAGYETLSAELEFTSYNYDPDEALAFWTAKMDVGGVTQYEEIENGLSAIVADSEPIAVVGDVQIFGDSNCLTYWNGDAKETLYARVNVPWGFNGGWRVPELLDCLAPTTQIPSDPYRIIYSIDWFSEDNEQPYSAGDVVTLTTSDPYEIENPIVVFTKP